MLKKFLIIATLLSFLICGCSTKVETEKESKEKQKQEQADDQFRKGNYQPSSGKKW